MCLSKETLKMGIRQLAITGCAVFTGIGLLYRKLDRDSQKYEARLEKTLREGLFKNGLHDPKKLRDKHPDALAFDEHGNPLSAGQIAKRAIKSSVGDPAKNILNSIKDGEQEINQEE